MSKRKYILTERMMIAIKPQELANAKRHAASRGVSLSLFVRQAMSDAIRKDLMQEGG